MEHAKWIEENAIRFSIANSLTDQDLVHNRADLEEHIKREMVIELAKEMMEKGIVEITKKDFNGVREITMSVTALPIIKEKVVHIGQTQVKLNGRPFVIGVDTFDHGDWFEGYFESDEEAVKHAKSRGGDMLKMHAYDKQGKHLDEGGTI